MISMQLQQYWEQTLQTPRYADPRRLLRFGAKAYSQHDEDGLIGEIFRRIGVVNSTFIEIGVGAGKENNTLALLLSGWSGLWLDAGVKNVGDARTALEAYIQTSRLRVEQAFVTRENIDSILVDAGYGGEIDLLSIDIDGNDYWIWEAIRSIQARVIVIEYNATWFPPLAMTVACNDSFHWDGSNYFGASLKALEILGRRKGYNLVGCGFAGINAFFVRHDLCGDRFLQPYSAENHFEPPRYWMYRASGHPAGVGMVHPIVEAGVQAEDLHQNEVRKAAPAGSEEDWTLLNKTLEWRPDVVIIMDTSHVVRFWPDAAERIFGYTAAEAVGRPIQFLAKDPENGFNFVIGDLRGAEVTTPLCRKDGAELQVRAKVYRTTVAHGEGHFISLFVRLPCASNEEGANVSSLHCHDARHARLAGLVDKVPAVLFTLDQNAVFTSVEGRGLELVGAHPDHLLGHSAYEMYGDDTPTAADLRRAFAGHVSVGSARIRDGIFATALAPLREGNDGVVTGVVGVAANISEQVV